METRPRCESQELLRLPDAAACTPTCRTGGVRFSGRGVAVGGFLILDAPLFTRGVAKPTGKSKDSGGLRGFAPFLNQ
jgi:hypothetical protein